MPEKIDELLRTAKEIQKQAAQRAARPAHGIAAGQIAGTSLTMRNSGFFLRNPAMVWPTWAGFSSR